MKRMNKAWLNVWDYHYDMAMQDGMASGEAGEWAILRTDSVHGAFEVFGESCRLAWGEVVAELRRLRERTR